MLQLLLSWLPKRRFNLALVYIGIFGWLFQLSALLYGYWQHQMWFQLPWYGWLGPFLCILWGIVPALQLQKEQASYKKLF